MVQVTEGQVGLAAGQVASTIAGLITKGKISRLSASGSNEVYLFGIPNGGRHAVLYVSDALWNDYSIPNRIVLNASASDVQIDDIMDTGNTVDNYAMINPNSTIITLFNAKDFGEYVRFPWESEHGGMEDQVMRILQFIGEDPMRNGLKDTPLRVVKMWDELFAGYKQDSKDVFKTFDNEEGYDEMILLKDIPFYSMCEHHMLPFFGKVHIAYIPADISGKIVGISKLARLVDIFSRRLQVQERMTKQIADAIEKHLRPSGVAVLVEGQHLCMQMRGVQKPGSVMTTSALLGALREEKARIEFLLLK